jgi:tol-pal system protein YbgF
MERGQTVMRERVAAALLILSVVVTLPVLAEEPPPDRRAVTGTAAATDSAVRSTLLDLLRQIDELQTEVRQLRNTAEVQGHELEQLKGRQRALYDDLDKRLREAERRGTATAPAAETAAAVAVLPGVAAPRVTTAPQQQEYDAAFDLMKQGLYDRAIKAFRAFLTKYPDSGLADNAQYWIAEGNYVLRNYKLALEEFGKVLNYPQSPKAPDASLKIGYVYYELGTYDKARKSLNEVKEHYPNTSVAKLAAARLDKMKKEGH